MYLYPLNHHTKETDGKCIVYLATIKTKTHEVRNIDSKHLYTHGQNVWMCVRVYVFYVAHALQIKRSK